MELWFNFGSIQKDIKVEKKIGTVGKEVTALRVMQGNV